jgi:2-dehydro-3-deoxyphosphogluconate aldolase/(4S)-4-hydroxy-2-oxoglutarate aldolase
MDGAMLRTEATDLRELDVEGFVHFFATERASAILRTADGAAVRPALDAAIRGGFRVVEITLTTPQALDHIEELAARPGVVVGAGTVLTVAEAREAVRRGARFLVSPITDEAVIGAARELGVASIPGAHTPTELVRAQRAGAPLQKLFPAPAGGPAYLRSCLAPLPSLRVVPTNGVDETNAAEWLAAGAFALGFVAALFRAEWMAKRDYASIEARARALLGIVQRASLPGL